MKLEKTAQQKEKSIKSKHKNQRPLVHTLQSPIKYYIVF